MPINLGTDKESRNALLKDNKKKRVFKMDTVITFGKKHNGDTIEEILDEDPEYVRWMTETFEDAEFDDEVLDHLLLYGDIEPDGWEVSFVHNFIENQLD